MADTTKRKRAGRLASGAAIMDAAAGLFLAKGYVGTSMDEVAARARVSKQTVYTHFTDKERLFTELVLTNTGRVDTFLDAIAAALHDATDVERALHELARRYVRYVTRPEVVQLRRLILAEAGRFPELARAYHERVPQRVVAAIAAELAHLTERGILRVDDVRVAADQFAWLVLGPPLDRAMFHGAGDLPAPAELDRLADAAVRTFLAAYSPR